MNKTHVDQLDCKDSLRGRPFERYNGWTQSNNWQQNRFDRGCDQMVQLSEVPYCYHAEMQLGMMEGKLV